MLFYYIFLIVIISHKLTQKCYECALFFGAGMGAAFGLRLVLEIALFDFLSIKITWKLNFSKLYINVTWSEPSYGYNNCIYHKGVTIKQRQWQ